VLHNSCNITNITIIIKAACWYGTMVVPYKLERAMRGSKTLFSSMEQPTTILEGDHSGRSSHRHNMVSWVVIQKGRHLEDSIPYWRIKKEFVVASKMPCRLSTRIQKGKKQIGHPWRNIEASPPDTRMEKPIESGIQCTNA
jgi:hypothetical protein